MRVCVWALATWFGVVGCASGTGAQNAAVQPRDEAGASFDKAREAALRGDSVRAEQYLSAALATGYPEHEVVSELVRVCVQSNRYRTAVRYLAPYARRHPRAIALRHVLATLYLAIGWDDDAAVELAEIVQLAPNHAVSHFLLGAHELGLGRATGPMHLRRYLALEPHGAHAAEARHLLERQSAQLGPESVRTDG